MDRFGSMMVSVWKRGWWIWYYDGKCEEEGGWVELVV